ncbi:hypothetical protein BGZ57DRAFT_586951 [Hyaloscypha finlandica]|nr:hypothetical protein BGZ57DRAFT_586951 [Hyaloscypha finlandica]
MRLDAVGSWEGGKRCSTNAHECLCMGYPNRDIPKRGMPHREHGHGQEYCTVLYILHTCNAQRSARIKLGWEQAGISKSQSQSLNMFGRGRPFLVAVITGARSREGSFTRSSLKHQHQHNIANLPIWLRLPFTQPPPLGRPVDPVRTRTAPHRALPLLQPCSRSSHFFPFIHSFIRLFIHSSIHSFLLCAFCPSTRSRYFQCAFPPARTGATGANRPNIILVEVAPSTDL